MNPFIYVEPVRLERMDDEKTLADAGREPFVSSVDAGVLEAIAENPTFFREHWKL